MHRYLIVANQTLDSSELHDWLEQLVGEGPCQLHLVVPATPAREQLVWTEGGAQAIARRRLAAALTKFRQMPAVVDGEVGDANPVLAVHDALSQGELPDGIIVVTLPSSLSRWLRHDLPRRIQRSTGLPVRAIVATPDPTVSGRVRRGSSEARPRSTTS
jgi:hypothetical protein